MKNSYTLKSVIALALIFLVCSSIDVRAQFVNNGASVTIVNKATLFVGTDFYNNASFGGNANYSASLGSHIIISGNLINNGNAPLFFSSDSSTVELKGSMLQLIGGTDSLNFYRLVIDNITDSLQMQKNISVLDSLTLLNGKLDLNGYEINLVNSGYLVGESNDSYIFGDSGRIKINLNLPPGGFSKNIGGLGATFTTSKNFGNTTFIRGHKEQGAADTSIFRYYDIQPSFTDSVEQFSFAYLNHELNEVGKSRLQLYSSKDQGATWGLVNGVNDSSNNAFSQQNVELPARLALANDICLQNPIQLNLGNDSIICENESILLDAGNPSLSYEWNTGDTSQQIMVAHGSYSVTVSRSNGCYAVDSINFTGTEIPSLIYVSDTALCSGIDSLVLKNRSSIAEGYTYLWNTADTTDTLSVALDQVSVDTFIVTATNLMGCVANDTSIVEVLSQPMVNLGNDTSLCQDDSLTLDATNASATYLWSTNDTTSTINIQSTSTFSVTVTRGICTANDTIDVVKSNLSVNSGIVNDVRCYGDQSGFIQKEGINGVAPYSYNWSTGDSNYYINNLDTGYYALTVTDNIGCVASEDSIYVGHPDSLQASFIVTNESCNFGMDGAIDLTVNGGTAPYNYYWGGNNIFEDLNGLVAGTYTVTITDDNGCTLIDSARVSRPNGFTVSKNFSNISCNNQNDASISYSLSGGTAPYTYTWSNSATGSSQTSLSAGVYTVLIEDANLCSYRDTINVVNPPALLLSLNGTNLNCNGDSSGSISASVSGGRGTYTYSWNNNETTQNLSNLSAGSYTLTVTDSAACQVVQSITITEPIILSSNILIADISCNGLQDGSLDLNVSGGVQPYTYLWSNNSSAEDLSALDSGKYYVTITDNKGCFTVDSAQVDMPTPLAITAQVNNVDCHGASTGAVDLTVNGGTSPYTFNWSNSQTTEDLNNLAAGTYSVTITDASNCSIRDTVNLTENTAIALTTTVQNANCNQADGIANVSASGGISPYTYLWLSTNTTTAADSNLAAGNYQVQVTDALGCTQTTTASVGNISGPQVTLDSIKNVNCFNDTTGGIAIHVSGGTQPLSFIWSNGDTTEDVSNLAAGNYALTLTDDIGCIATVNYNVNEGDSIGAGLMVSNISCYNALDGAVSANATGGNGSYTYNWSNAQNTPTINNLSAGTYSITVTDSLGCVLEDSVTVNEPDSLQANIVGTDLSCFKDFNGAVQLNPLGGTTPYTYNWSNTSISQNISNLPAGKYVVTLTDANNCFTTDSVVLSQPDTLKITSTLIDVLCSSDSTGSVGVTVNGGTLPYTYNWSNSASDDSIANLSAGTYSLTLTDANTCSKTASYTIIEPMPISILLNAQDVACFGDSTGSIRSQISGGITPYTYTWSNNETTADINSLSSGNYTLSVNDANGCVEVDSAQVKENTLISVQLTTTDISCYGDQNGSIQLTVSGGVTPYSYQWNDMNTGQDRSNLEAGVYSVTITDQSNCSIVKTDTIIEPNQLKINDFLQDVSCSGTADGSIQLTVNGGVTPYSYQWSSGQSTDSIGSLAGGNYAVTITDANNCFITGSYNIVNPQPIQLNAQITNIGCGDEIDGGSIQLQTTGGTKPYTYNWSNGDTTSITDNLLAGGYSVSLVDAKGCQSSGSYTISTDGNPVFARYLSASYATSGDSIVFINISAPRGASPLWDMDDSTIYATEDVIHSYNSRFVTEGDTSYYWVTLVVDNGSCIDSISKKIAIRNLNERQKQIVDTDQNPYQSAFIQEVDLYPVPTVNQLTYKVRLAKADQLTYHIYDLKMNLIESNSVGSRLIHKQKIDVSYLAKGNYFIIFDTPTDRHTVKFIKM